MNQAKSLLLFLFLLWLPEVTKAQCCCEPYKDKGQEAYNKSDYQKAIFEWKQGKACPDAPLCADFDQLINQAQDQIKRIDNLTKALPDTAAQKPATSGEEPDTTLDGFSDHSYPKGWIVVLDVCVDRDGKVISAEYREEGSNTTDKELIRITKTNALAWKFSAGGPEKQCGTITYRSQ